jgi:hypothetical protein
MSDNGVDNTFELFLVIISILSSIMGSYPEFFWSATPGISLEITTMRSTILPLLILTILWITGKLIMNENHQVLLKIVAWMTAVGISVGNFTAYLEGVKYVSGGSMDVYIAVFTIFILTLAFVYGIIVPRYKEMYSDDTFFSSETRSKLALSYILYIVLFLGLAYLGATEYQV